MQKILFSIIAGSVLTACSGTTSQPTHTSSAESYYQARCGSCHEPVAPENHYTFQWERLLTLMVRDIEPSHKAMQPILSAEEKEHLLSYIRPLSPKEEEKDNTDEVMRQQLRELQ